MNTIKNAAGQDVTIIMTERVTVEVVPTENGLYTFGNVARSFTASEKEFVLGQVKEVVRAIEEEAYTLTHWEEAVTSIEYMVEDEESVTYAVETVEQLDGYKGLYRVKVFKEEHRYGMEERYDMEITDVNNGHNW